MANSPQTPDEIRCGMCGKLNLADSPVCQYCGARLRPMTAEELGLTPAMPTSPLRWPEERKKPEPEPEDPDDLLGGLRSQLADADDATIIGPSASKDRIKRQDLFENVEPDFTVGKPAEPPAAEEESAVPGDTSVSGEVPDWLRDASKSTDTGSLQAPSGQMPDWLVEETRATEPPSPIESETFEIPDWLGKPADEDGESASSVDETPDWMQNLDQPDEKATPIAGVPDWLIDETKPSESQPPAAPSDDALEWLATVPPPEPADELDLGIPDWLDEAATGRAAEPAAAPQAETPDWLREPEPAESDQLEEPEAETPLGEMDVPDWLRESAEAEAPSVEEEAPAPLISSGMPDWLVQATSESPAAEPPAEEIDLETPDWLRAPQDEPVEQEAPTPISEMETPDWLRAPEEVEPETETQAETFEAPEQLSAEPEIPAWLGGLGLGAVEPSEPAPESEAPIMQEAASDIEIGVPDWLSDLSGQPAESVKSEPEIAEQAETQPEVPDWLAGLGAEPAAPTMEAPIETPAPIDEAQPEVPDWLSDLSGQSTQTVESEPEIAEQAEVQPEVPDWLAGLSEEPAAPAMEAPIETPASTEEQTEVPDWLTGLGAEPAAPVEAPASEEVPDWLSDMSSEPAASVEAPAQEEVPDWLSGVSSEPAAPVEAPSSEEVPDWLSGVSSEPAAPSTQAPAEDEVPDWLSGVSSEPAAPSTEAPAEDEVPDWLSGVSSEPTAPVEAPTSEEVPDWLSGVSSEPAARVEAPTSEEVPDWLSGVSSEPAARVEAPTSEEVPDWLSGESSEPAAPSTQAPAEDEVPDWLSGVSSEPAAPSTQAPAEDEVPDWLSGASSEPAAPAPSAFDETPDWLRGAESETPALESPTHAPAEEVPDWLSGAETPQVPSAEADTPEWLSDITGETSAPAAEPAASTGGSPDWLADLDDLLGMPSEMAPVPEGSEDLLGLSDDFALPTEDEEEALAEAGSLPSWLHDSDTSPDLLGLALGDVPAELADLRFESVTGQQSKEPIVEKVGALKDVTGAIRPEIIFDGRTLEVGKLTEELVVTNDQRKRIEALEALADRQARGVVVAETPAAFPIERWAITLVLLFVMLVAALMASQGTTFLATPAASTDVEVAADIISNKVPAGSTVVMVFEYDADSAGELEPLASTLLEHLASRNMQVYAISTRPAGPALAQRAISGVEAADATDQWVNFGYLAGGAKGISALVTGDPLITSPLAVDYQGQATDLEAAFLTDLNPALLVIVSSRWEDLRGWIEQTENMQTQKIVATSLSSAPMAYPYEESGQINVVLSGVNDAAQYRAVIGSEMDAAGNAAWNGQAMGSLAASLMIVIGSVFYGIRALRQQEQD